MYTFEIKYNIELHLECGRNVKYLHLAYADIFMLIRFIRAVTSLDL